VEVFVLADRLEGMIQQRPEIIYTQTTDAYGLAGTKRLPYAAAMSASNS
jgi:hypothetical protein